MSRWNSFGLILPLVLVITTSTTPAWAASGGGGPLDWRADLAIFSAVVFLLLLAILWKFAWGPISQALDRREQNIADNIARAEEAAEEAHKLTSQYEAKLASAAEEVRAMIEEARRDAEHTKQQIVSEAQEAAAAETVRATREIETAKVAALKELADRTTDFSLGLAGQVLQRELSPKEHAQLIERATSDFLQLDASQN
ncbi:MAG: ATP synthase F0 subunit B [Planctomycetota bacterium]|nr:MAG: ATP synthase F0 subunit B [Planctomycetota bacterium]REJ87618.1 MAG: ATP synthase F0 subunit B [Planctomycetota bacterium]REK30168.1 MAG: ATP synthase F0 subunit B [Planctomycetota bacterium]REK43305.1 MAG: ATP synthase F0 subunit B [Planctomycetota bacterium]